MKFKTWGEWAAFRKRNGEDDGSSKSIWLGLHRTTTTKSQPREAALPLNHCFAGGSAVLPFGGLARLACTLANSLDGCSFSDVNELIAAASEKTTASRLSFFFTLTVAVVWGCRSTEIDSD